MKCSQEQLRAAIDSALENPIGKPFGIIANPEVRTWFSFRKPCSGCPKARNFPVYRGVVFYFTLEVPTAIFFYDRKSFIAQVRLSEGLPAGI